MEHGERGLGVRWGTADLAGPRAVERLAAGGVVVDVAVMVVVVEKAGLLSSRACPWRACVCAKGATGSRNGACEE